VSDPGEHFQRTFDVAFEMRQLHDQVHAIRQGQLRHDSEFVEVKRQLLAIDERVTQGFREVSDLLVKIVDRLPDEPPVASS
jgi:hypothetical protein